jgi:hypothetical protein
MLRFIVLLAAVLHSPALSAQSAFKPIIPRVWDEAALAGGNASSWSKRENRRMSQPGNTTP